MRFPDPLVAARLVRRYKRFLADFVLEEDGSLVTAHCANPGSMLTCLETGARGWLSHSTNPRNKLRFVWQIAEVGSCWIYVHPLGVNRVVREGIENGLVGELAGYPSLRAEVPYGRGSRIDFLLQEDARTCYVEVKSATLRLGPGLAGFPDAVTGRGLRHLEELRHVVQRGARAVVLFCVSRSDARRFAPADRIDPAFGRALREAARDGVEVLAYRVVVSPRGVSLKARVPVELGE